MGNLYNRKHYDSLFEMKESLNIQNYNSECLHCSSIIYGEERFCDSCLEKMKKFKRKIIYGLMLILLSFVIFLMILKYKSHIGNFDFTLLCSGFATAGFIRIIRSLKELKDIKTGNQAIERVPDRNLLGKSALIISIICSTLFISLAVIFLADIEGDLVSILSIIYVITFGIGFFITIVSLFIKGSNKKISIKAILNFIISPIVVLILSFIVFCFQQ